MCANKTNRILKIIFILGIIFISQQSPRLFAFSGCENRWQNVITSCLSPKIQLTKQDFSKIYKKAIRNNMKKSLRKKVTSLEERLYEDMDQRNRCLAVNWNLINGHTLVRTEKVTDGVTYLLYRGNTDEGFGQEYYEFLMKNNKLIGYGSTYFFSGTAQLTFHIFEKERGRSKPRYKGRSKRLMLDRLRGLQDLSSMTIIRFDLPADQVNNEDAINYGAVVFYMKMGFMPKKNEMHVFYLQMMQKINNGMTLSYDEISRLAAADWELRTREINIFSKKLYSQIPEIILSKLTELDSLDNSIAQSI